MRAPRPWTAPTGGPGPGCAARARWPTKGDQRGWPQAVVHPRGRRHGSPRTVPLVRVQGQPGEGAGVAADARCALVREVGERLESASRGGGSWLETGVVTAGARRLRLRHPLGRQRRRGAGGFRELAVYGTDPLLPDIDDDGLGDFVEVRTHKANPTVLDSDGDGRSDGEEVATGSNPLGGFERLRALHGSVDQDTLLEQALLADGTPAPTAAASRSLSRHTRSHLGSRRRLGSRRGRAGGHRRGEP